MGFNLEENNSEINEVDDKSVAGEQLSETEETSEDFEDCNLKEIEDSNGEEVSSDSWKEAEEEFDDCEAGLDEVKEENPESDEEAVEDLDGQARENEELKEQIEASWYGMTVDEYRDYKMAEQDDMTLKELMDNSELNAEELERMKVESAQLSEDAEHKFDSVMKETRGTEAYKDALQDYNAARDKHIEVQSEISELEKNQTDLNQKTMKLRDAQLRHGEMAMNASEESLNMSDSLQDKFEQSFYGDADLSDLNQIQNQNSRVISEMSAERDAIQLAREAKMSEIQDYVYANNLERYDTERDPSYQKLISEYREFDEAYEKLNYNVVKLDENNIQISEVTGSDYESIQYRSGTKIAEVKNGSDIPGETDYFIDETRAREVLEPFQQNNWEQLSVREQKAAVEQLSQYNADILGIENPPAVVYYRNNDATDFGGFSASQHTIFINELNMGDAAETADTISHEYRHCYQHERAELLENERDLAYKEGFDNYISPENNYLAYKNQLVEQDARDYADAVRQKIESFNNSDDNLSHLPEKPEGDVKSFETLHPEKGAVFEQTTTDQLPDDFKKKIVEIKNPKEVFEAAELQEIKDHVTPAYENGAEIAEHIEEFNTYKEHHKIDGGHIEKVHDKSLQAADVLEKLFNENSYGEIYSDNIDRKALEMMALYHDTGMDGNISAGEFEQAKQDYLNRPGVREAYIEKQMKEAASEGKEMTYEEANAKFESKCFESQFRKEHSVQSAVHALRDREFIESHGADADRVALGCLAHSKSNSGVQNLADESDWNCAVDRLQNAVKEFNETHPDEQIHFSDSFLRKTDGTFDPDSLGEMRSEALCLRIGDANGHDSGSHTSQNGKEIKFDLNAWSEVQNDLPADLESKILAGDCSDFQAEVKNARVEIDGKILDDTNDKSGFSRMFAVGEGNFKDVNLELVDGMPTQKFDLENGNAYPLSTQYCILERLKEYNTAKIAPQMEIERPMGMTDAEFTEYKTAQIDAMEKIDFVAEINVGRADGRTIASYEAFADKVSDQYGIKVHIKSEPADVT